MRVASAVYVADFVEGRALFPCRGWHGVEGAIGVGELEAVSVMLGGRRPVIGVSGAAIGGEDVGGVDRVGGESVPQDGGRALGAGGGGGGAHDGASPYAMMEGVGEAVCGAAQFAFGRSVVACCAKAAAGPGAASEDGGDDAFLERAQRGGPEHLAHGFVDYAAGERRVGEFFGKTVEGSAAQQVP